MNNRRLTHGLLFTFATILVAGCGGDNPAPVTPPAPTAAPEAAMPSAMPSAAPVDTAAAAASAAPTAAPAAEPPPPVKTLKDKIAGSWVGAIDQDKAMADATKKAGKADKDGSKAKAIVQKEADAAAKNTMDAAADSFAISINGKPAAKGKWHVVKEDGSNLIVHEDGKDEVTKKESKDDMTITFVDDNTITTKDPKNPKGTLTFKRK